MSNLNSVKDQVKAKAPMFVGSLLQAETYFKSPAYQDSYYFPYNPDPLARGNNYRIYDEMANDDQVKVAISFKKDITVNSGWSIKCDIPQIKQFVTDAIRRMEESGGLGMSFEDTIRDMLAYEYGFSLAEPIFKIKGNLYTYESLRVRPPHSFRFEVDDFGNVYDVVQMTAKGEKHFDPKIFIHHVYQQEYDNPYGKSDLRAAHQAWIAKKFVTKFLAIYLERFATPTVIGKYPQNWDTDEVARFNSQLNTLQHSTTLVMPESAIVDFMKSNQDSSDTYIKALNYYNMHIARALLVPDLLGISGDKTGGGSFALGQDQFKLFLATIEKDRQSLARKLTLRMVAPLVKANFGQNIPCEFAFTPYSMDDNIELMKVWADIAKGNIFQPNPEEINYLRKQLKFPEGPVVKSNPPVPAFPGAAPGASMPPVPTQQALPPSQPPKQASFASQRRILRRTQFQGLPINVEIEPGQTKSGVGPDGTLWSHVYKYPYGEVGGSEGADGDAVDCYIGPNLEAKNVYVIHQLDHRGQYDEDKVFLGFESSQEAEQAYLDHGPAFGFGTMEIMTLNHFRNGYLASNRKFALKRELTSAEKKVDFKMVQESLEKSESSMSKHVRSAAKKIWMDYLKQIKDSNLIERFDPKRLTELKPKFLKDMNIELKHGFRDLLEQAYDEAEKELFPTKKFGLDEGELEFEDMMEVLDAEAFNITAYYAGLTLKMINTEIANGLKQGLSTSDIISRMRDAFPDETDRWLNTLFRTKTTEIYNRGRKSYFDNDQLAQKVIDGYQFSAILDDRTSEICRALDKKVFRKDDENINLILPALHFNCRSIVVPVTIYEKDVMEEAEEVPSREELQDMGASLLSLKGEVR